MSGVHILYQKSCRCVKAIQYDGKNGRNISKWLKESTNGAAVVAFDEVDVEIIINDGEDRLLHAIPGDWVVYEDCPIGSTPEVWVMPNVDRVEHFK